MSKKNKIVAIALVVSFPITFFMLLPWLHLFLSRNHLVSAKTLVIQGWIFDTMMDQATAEFHRGNYERIIVTGTGNSTKNGRARLMERGIDQSLIAVAIAKAIKKGWHNTFSEAYGLKWYIRNYAPEINAVNIVTSAVHGRKTETVFKKVLGDSIAVGVITCRSNYYNADKIWTSPLGIKVTIKFFIGYLYALVWNVRVQ